MATNHEVASSNLAGQANQTAQSKRFREEGAVFLLGELTRVPDGISESRAASNTSMGAM